MPTIPSRREPRAQRFTISMSIAYRAAGEVSWRQGRVMNISYSGILFEAGDLIDPGTRLEMRFVLPVSPSARPGAEVSCSGEVVRRSARSRPEDVVAIAASISKYRLRRQAGYVQA